MRPRKYRKVFPVHQYGMYLYNKVNKGDEDGIKARTDDLLSTAWFNFMGFNDGMNS